MSYGRRICICSECSEEKLHYGFGMCSACLRKNKRQNRPEFYLGVCYSEMSRRVKVFDELRPNYYGKDICTRDEFVSYFIKDKNFLRQYKIWQDSGFLRYCSPSIDRVDNDNGYTLDNMQFISQSENGSKDKKIPIILTNVNDNKSYTFTTTGEAANFIGSKRATIFKYKNLKKPYKGWYISELS